MQYQDAYKIAEHITVRLAPHCEDERCLVAGSIRRKKAECGDIEIVCQPKATMTQSLFPEADYMRQDPMFRETVLELGKPIKGNPAGRMMQIELPQVIMLDLFMPQPDDFFRQFAIRTGSSQYSQNVIAIGWRKLGWVGTPDGLRKEEQSTPKENYFTGIKKITWTCSVSNPQLPPEWKSEEEFFEWLKVPFIIPEKRF